MELSMAATTPRTRLDFYPSPELRKAIDRWRIEQDGEPTRAEAVRRIVEDWLTTKGAFKPARAPAKRKAAK
jgi:hypothetical protein